MKEATIFAAFFAITLVAHTVQHKYHDFKEKHPESVIKMHIRSKVIAFVLTSLLHPNLWFAVKEYLVHLIVYSGSVIGAH